MWRGGETRTGWPRLRATTRLRRPFWGRELLANAVESVACDAQPVPQLPVQGLGGIPARRVHRAGAIREQLADDRDAASAGGRPVLEPLCDLEDQGARRKNRAAVNRGGGPPSSGADSPGRWCARANARARAEPCCSSAAGPAVPWRRRGRRAGLRPGTSRASCAGCAHPASARRTAESSHRSGVVPEPRLARRPSARAVLDICHQLQGWGCNGLRS